jgi:SAM-dependent methyltransferase
MEEAAYLALAASETKGWYYRARRQAVRRLISLFAPDRKLRILDFGCGTGGSSQGWLEFGEVIGIEPSPLARKIASERYPHLKILPVDWETLSPAALGSYDLIIILCVLYHREVQAPLELLMRLSKLQKSGDLLIWNEPAYAHLWRQHDRQTASGRRFHPKQMISMLEAAGYKMVFKSHLLAWAYPIALILAARDRWRWGKDRSTLSAEEGSDHKPVPTWLNQFLQALTFTEWSFNLRRLGLPFGVSCLMVARKI